MSFDARLDVPEARSRAATRATARPRAARAGPFLKAPEDQRLAVGRLGEVVDGRERS